jgi:hypothetical protein
MTDPERHLLCGACLFPVEDADTCPRCGTHFTGTGPLVWFKITAIFHDHPFNAVADAKPVEEKPPGESQ